MILLSARQLQVLELLADGLTLGQIAGRLYITEGTVKQHRAALATKLGAHTAAQAVAQGFREGLLRLDGSAERLSEDVLGTNRAGDRELHACSSRRDLVVDLRGSHG